MLWLFNTNVIFIDINASACWEQLNDGNIYNASKLVLIANCLLESSADTIDDDLGSSITRRRSCLYNGLSEQSKVLLSALRLSRQEQSNLISVTYLAEVEIDPYIHATQHI